MFFQALVFSAALFGGVSPEPFATDHVDAVEVNHFHNSDGDLVFSQTLFREWDFDDHYIAAWRISTNRQGQQMSIGGRQQLLWAGPNGVRRVFTDRIFETWTQNDPEIDERNARPRAERRGLFGRTKDVSGFGDVAN